MQSAIFLFAKYANTIDSQKKILSRNKPAIRYVCYITVCTLPQELQALFSEMSALSGDNVLQAHTTLGSLLLARENDQLERAKKTAIKLAQEGGQKKTCRC